MMIFSPPGKEQESGYAPIERSQRTILKALEPPVPRDTRALDAKLAWMAKQRKARERAALNLTVKP